MRSNLGPILFGAGIAAGMLGGHLVHEALEDEQPESIEQPPSEYEQPNNDVRGDILSIYIGGVAGFGAGTTVYFIHKHHQHKEIPSQLQQDI